MTPEERKRLEVIKAAPAMYGLDTTHWLIALAEGESQRAHSEASHNESLISQRDTAIRERDKAREQLQHTYCAWCDFECSITDPEAAKAAVGNHVMECRAHPIASVLEVARIAEAQAAAMRAALESPPDPDEQGRDEASFAQVYREWYHERRRAALQSDAGGAVLEVLRAAIGAVDSANDSKWSTERMRRLETALANLREKGWSFDR